MAFVDLEGRRLAKETWSLKTQIRLQAWGLREVCQTTFLFPATFSSLYFPFHFEAIPSTENSISDPLIS